MLRRWRDALRLLGSRYYFLVTQDEGDNKILCSGLNNELIREYNNWFDKVIEAVEMARKNMWR